MGSANNGVMKHENKKVSLNNTLRNHVCQNRVVNYFI